MTTTKRFDSHLLGFLRGVSRDPKGWFQAGKDAGWFSTDVIDRSWMFGRWKARIHWRRGDGIMGRFGGGWSWQLGIVVGGTTILFHLVFFTLTVSRLPKPKVRN